MSKTNKKVIESTLNKIALFGYGYIDIHTAVLEPICNLALVQIDNYMSVEDAIPSKTGDYEVIDPNALSADKTCIMRFDSYNKHWFIGDDQYHPSHWRKVTLRLSADN